MTYHFTFTHGDHSLEIKLFVSIAMPLDSLITFLQYIGSSLRSIHTPLSDWLVEIHSA